MRAGVAALLTVIGLAGCVLAPLHREVRQQTLPFRSGTALEVFTRNGSITVSRAETGRVEVEAELASPSLERLQAARLEARYGEDAALRVRVRWPEDRWEPREVASFRIRIPGTVGVRLTSTNGSLHLQGLAGEARLQTTNGSIRVERHDGPVEAQTTNGAVRLAEILGPGSARTRNGSVSALAVAGALQVETANGSVTIRVPAGHPGPVEARTVNGGIRLTLPADFTGSLEARTGNGRVRVEERPGLRFLERRRHRVVLQVAAEEPRIFLRTENGSIRIRWAP